MSKYELENLAYTLIFGTRSGNRRESHSVYGLGAVKKYGNLVVRPISSLDAHTGTLSTKRFLRIKEQISLVSSHVQVGTDVAKIITYENTSNRTNISDTIFTDKEFEYAGYQWEQLVKNKIIKIGMLIGLIIEGKKDDAPLLINEFPNISSLLIKLEPIINWKRK